MHAELDKALKELARDEPGIAEQRLICFAAALAEDAKVGSRYTTNANRQAATALLVTGLIAKKRRSDTDSAKTAWVDALQHNSTDAEVIRCLAELDLDAQRDEPALRGLRTSVEMAPNDKRLIAETAELRSQIYQRKKKPLLERGALHEAASNFVMLDENARAAKAYSRAAELEQQPLRMVVEAPKTLRKAYNSYFYAGDRTGAEDVRQRLIDLKEEVSSLPSFAEPTIARSSWPWIRLAGELLLFGAAAYLFFLTQR